MRNRLQLSKKMVYKIKVLIEGTYHPTLSPLPYKLVVTYLKRFNHQTIHWNTVRNYYMRVKNDSIPSDIEQMFKQNSDYQLLNMLEDDGRLAEFMTGSDEQFSHITDIMLNAKLKQLHNILKENSDFDEMLFDDFGADGWVNNEAEQNQAHEPKHTVKHEVKPNVTLAFTRKTQSHKPKIENKDFDPAKYQ